MRETKSTNMAKLKHFTLRELSGIVGVSYRTLCDYVKDGKIKAVKFGGKWRVSETSVMEFLKSCESNQAAH